MWQTFRSYFPVPRLNTAEPSTKERNCCQPKASMRASFGIHVRIPRRRKTFSYTSDNVVTWAVSFGLRISGQYTARFVVVSATLLPLLPFSKIAGTPFGSYNAPTRKATSSHSRVHELSYPVHGNVLEYRK